MQAVAKKLKRKITTLLKKLHDDMKITFEEDTSKDGILNNAEANRDHSETTTTATIKLPSNFVVGDKLEVESHNEDAPDNKTTKEYIISKDASGNLVATDGSETLNITDDSDGNKVVKYTLNLTEDHTTIINAKVTGAAGDVTETKSDIMLDAQGSGSGTKFRLFIDEDKDRNGVLSRDEAMKDHQLNTTSATLQIPTSVKANDTIAVSVNGGSPKIYTVVSNDGINVVIKDAGGHIVPTPDNKLTISDVHHIGKDHLAKVEATIGGVTKTAEAKLETFDATNLKVEFKENNASRDDKIDRDESVSVDGVKVTTISVQVPYNVITGDRVDVLITEPKTGGTTADRHVKYTVSKASNGDISLVDENGVSHPLRNNTIEISDVEMLPGKETSAKATITNAAGDMSATSPDAKVQLAPLSEAGLSVSIADDKNDDGVISRDESGSNTSKVKVSIPGSVIKGDKIDVEITNPDSTNAIKNYEVVGKDANGNITLKDLADNSQHTLSRDQSLELDAKIAVGAETKAKVTLTDAFGEKVNVEDTAQHADIEAMRGIMFNKNITTLESGEKATTAKFFLNEDARAGDTVEIKYTDPSDHTQTKTGTYTLTDQDIGKGAFEYSLDIDARSRAGYDLKVEATLKTPGHLQSETYESDQSFHINAGSYTIKYDANKTMEGGDSNNDTLLVADGQTVDFSHVRNIEKLDIKNGEKTTLSLSADDIKDMLRDGTESKLKLDGDSNDEVTLTGGNWTKGDSNNGYTSYSDGTTTIEIKEEVQNVIY